LLHVGPIAIRYYGLCFGLAIVTGFAVWYRRALRFGESPRFAESLLWYAIPGIVIGGRLGYCFFYAPSTYITNPVRILAIWEGGIASHGVAIGLAAALWAFAKRHDARWFRLADYFAPAAALAVGWIRVGNFFNSEIIGRATDVPWAVVFARRDDVPRHPAQLYDMLIGPVTWLVLRFVERRGIRPVGSGLVAGVFLCVYFGIRIFVEQFKDFYVEQLRDTSAVEAAERTIGSSIHTGQILSLIPVLAGVFLIVRALRRGSAPPNAGVTG
jgi:prolipoprotein diacylglyceryl transferase